MQSDTTALPEIPRLKLPASGNDMHIDGGVVKPGLGPDQPDEVSMQRLQAEAVANFERKKRLDEQAAELQKRGADVEDREQDLDTREATIAQREATAARLTQELEMKQRALDELDRRLKAAQTPAPPE